MEIHILSREEARTHVPNKPELLIGILDSKPPLDCPIALPENKLRLKYLTYKFDDITEPFRDYVLINDEIARKMLEDFRRFKDRIGSLAVHCDLGISRSPAVASALNDCFSLVPPEEFFSDEYQLNMKVYNTIFRCGL